MMDTPSAIKQRMEELGLEQKDLAAGAEVTESYISQLLSRRKAPPAPERTDIYSKLEKALKLPKGRLSTLADFQRKEELKRRIVEPPAPLYKEVRQLILRKCAPETREQVRVIFEKQPFGELERLVTQKILDVAKRLASQELHREEWLHSFARLSRRRYEDVRVSILEFLDTDVFHLSDENCVAFLDPMIESWDVDFATFGIEIILNRRLVPGEPKRFEFVEREADGKFGVEPGLEEFLADRSLSGTATEEEIEFLQRLRFKGRRPTPMYYYRELQSLRDPLHFRKASPEKSEVKARSRKRAAPERLRRRSRGKGL
jgi:transcriptional regulator with XRE-family HTH domain